MFSNTLPLFVVLYKLNFNLKIFVNDEKDEKNHNFVKIYICTETLKKVLKF